MKRDDAILPGNISADLPDSILAAIYKLEKACAAEGVKYMYYLREEGANGYIFKYDMYDLDVSAIMGELSGNVKNVTDLQFREN